ncbi:MAG TPA: glycosyltransferase [Amaricoccus sp.]|nr:glycosyltransferase [Amaricoccus sp.]
MQAHAAGGEADRVQSLVAGLGASGDFVADVLRLITADRGRGETGRALAYSLRDTAATREVGELAVGLLAAQRRLWGFAAESFAGCGTESLARYQLSNALEAFVATGEARAGDLARTGARLLPEIGSRLGDRELLRVAGFCAALGLDDPMERFLGAAEAREGEALIAARAASLRRHRAAAKAAASELGCDDGHAALFAAALDAPTPPAGERLQIGILDYGNPTIPSTNIGDHIQTIGVLGQLGAFDFADLKAPSGVMAVLGAERATLRQPVATPVRVVPVDRDFALAQSTLGRIWLPVCGWFQHEAYSGHHVFPFPGNILPIYMSLHVAAPDILGDLAIEHLKRFAPIGCRDLNTVRLLRNAGVPAFFNGCVTLTLDRLFPPHDPEEQGPRHGRFFADYSDHGQVSGGHMFVGHLQEEIVARSLSENLAVAAGLLARYRTAEAVRTPLLHCYLPCRAMGTPVEFANETLSNPRFEGLVGIPDDEVRRIADRLEVKFTGVMSAILAGAEPDAVYATWRELSAPDMAHTDALLLARHDALRRKLPPAEKLDPAVLAAVPRHRFGAAGAAPLLDLVFCFDAGLAEPFLATLGSAVAHASRWLRVHILGRDLPQGFAEVLSREFPDLGFVICDMSGVRFGKVDLLPHTSVSTMDRLVAPEILSDVGRAIYLDVDVLVRGDLAELAGIDLGDAAVAARDSIDEDLRTGYALLQELAKHMEPDVAAALRSTVLGEGTIRFAAFNAGVLVMDFDRLRAAGFSERAFDLVGRFGMNDQVALNLLVRDKRTRLPAEWNHFPSQEKLADPRIVHFVGPVKPWHLGSYHPWFEAWRAHAASGHPDTRGASPAARDRIEAR